MRAKTLEKYTFEDTAVVKLVVKDFNYTIIWINKQIDVYEELQQTTWKAGAYMYFYRTIQRTLNRHIRKLNKQINLIQQKVDMLEEEIHG